MRKFVFIWQKRKYLGCEQMHDIIIDDTPSSLAASYESSYRSSSVSSVSSKKKGNGSSGYFIGFLAKFLIVASLLAIDFLLFAGSGSYRMFSSETFLTMEVWYILAGIFVLSLAAVYLFSFSTVLQNLLVSFVVFGFVVVMLNQFAALDKDSMLSQMMSTYLIPDMGRLIGNISYVGLAVFIALISLVVLFLAPKFVLGILAFLLLFFMFCVVGLNYQNQDSNVKYQVVKEDESNADAQIGKRFVFIGMPTLETFNSQSEAMAQAAKDPEMYARLKESRDILLGFYARNNFTYYPYAYVDEMDPYVNLAETLNTNNDKSLSEYQLQDILIKKLWKFDDLTPKYIYLRENKLFDTFKRAKYGINAYQSKGIELCTVDNSLAVDRCVEKKYLPMDFDGMNVTDEEKVEILLAQWIESMDVFEDFSYIHGLTAPFLDADNMPLLGKSFKNADVKDSLETLDLLEKDLHKDSGNKAYFAYLNVPGDMYIYDEFCKIKPVRRWKNKVDYPWVRRGSNKDRQTAYNEQLRCVLGKLETFLKKLDNSPLKDKTVVVLQGLNGIDVLYPTQETNFASVLKNQKYVDMAIRDPIKKGFRVGSRICSVPGIMKQYLYRKEACTELSGFNLHEKAIAEMVGVLRKHTINRDMAQNAIHSFDDWYQKWLDAHPELKETEVVKNAENLPSESENTPEKEIISETTGTEKTLSSVDNGDENMNENAPEKVIHAVPVPENLFGEIPEDKVQSLGEAMADGAEGNVADKENALSENKSEEVSKGDLSDDISVEATLDGGSGN